MASTKAGGSAKNLNTSNPKYLGVKLADGASARPGMVIVRQRGTKIEAGKNVAVGRDHTLFSLATGKVELINAVKISPTQTEFHLSPKDTCDELEHLYLNDKLMVSASRIADKVQTLNTIKRGNQ